MKARVLKKAVIIGCALVVTGLVVSAPAEAVPPAYRLTTVSGLPYSATAYDINEAGQAVIAIPGSPARGYTWDGSALAELPGASGSSGAYPYAINDSGQVVGFTPSGSRIQAALWTSGVLTELSRFGGTWSEARDINDSGQVAGIYEISGVRRPFFWENGVMTDLGLPVGYRNTQPLAMNNAAQIVGCTDSSTRRRAFLFDHAQWTILPPLSNKHEEACDINDFGQVVGHSGEGIACLWSGAQVIELWSSSIRYAFSYGINNGGQVVGMCDVDEGRHAYFWENGNTYDLNDFLPPGSGWTLNTARAINDRGQIVGEGQCDGYGYSSFILTPPLRSVNATYLDTAFDATTGELAVDDSADMVVEWWNHQQQTYPGGTFSMTALLFDDMSASGVASALFQDGAIEINGADGTPLLTADLLDLLLEEIQGQNLLAGTGQFQVTGGTLEPALQAMVGDIVQITFDIDAGDLADFSAAFSGVSNVTLTPEPATLGLVAAGLGAVWMRKRRVTK